MLKKIYLSMAMVLFFTFGVYYLVNLNLNKFAEYLFVNMHSPEVALFLLENLGKEDDYYTMYLKGRINFVYNNLDKSISDFTKSIEINDGFTRSYYGRGLAYSFHGGNYLAQAENDFKKYIELSPKAYGLWAGYNDLAWVYYIKSDYPNAEKVARSGLEISPGNPWLLNMLGIILIEQNKCTQAIPLLEQAIKVSEELSPEEFGEAYSGDHRKNWTSGVENMKKAIGENLALCKVKEL